MVLPRLLLALSAIVAAVAAVPVTHDDAPDDERSGRCVNGEITQLGPYKVNYKVIQPASNTSTTGYIIDPDWMAAHNTFQSVLIDGTYRLYCETKCQYSCNGTPGCVAYVAYENKANKGDFECYFFKTLIEPANIVPRVGPNTGTRELTHAFNKLCNVRAMKENMSDP